MHRPRELCTVVDKHRKGMNDKGKHRPCEVRRKTSRLSPVASEHGQGVYFISHLLSLFKLSLGVEVERKHDVMRLISIKMQTCRLYPAPDTPFHFSLETEDYKRNLFKGRKERKQKTFPYFLMRGVLGIYIIFGFFVSLAP